MQSKRLITCAILALLVLAATNALIARAARTTLRRQFLATLDHLPPAVNCLFLGNSLVEAGCNPAAFQAAWIETNTNPISNLILHQSQSPRSTDGWLTYPLSPRARAGVRGNETPIVKTAITNPQNHPPPFTAVNLGLGATTPVEHYLILKHALEHSPNVKYLIYGFFDDQLNSPVHGDWNDLVGNRAFSYYYPDEAAAFYAPGSRLQAWQMRVIAGIPMFAERSSLWGKVELLRRRLGEIGMPHHKINRFGRVADFSALEAGDVASFTQRCAAVVQQQKGFSPPIREILRLAREHGVIVFLVEMPMPAQHRKLFYSLSAWNDLRSYLQSLAAAQNAIYIPASDWIPDAGNFEDAVHLNEQGATEFSHHLATTLLKTQTSEHATRNTQPKH